MQTVRQTKADLARLEKAVALQLILQCKFFAAHQIVLHKSPSDAASNDPEGLAATASARALVGAGF